MDVPGGKINHILTKKKPEFFVGQKKEEEKFQFSEDKKLILSLAYFVLPEKIKNQKATILQEKVTIVKEKVKRKRFGGFNRMSTCNNNHH